MESTMYYYSYSDNGAAYPIIIAPYLKTPPQAWRA